VSKRHRHHTRRQHRKVLGVELPRGVLENAGVFGGCGKKALQICEATGAQVCNVATGPPPLRGEICTAMVTNIFMS